MDGRKVAFKRCLICQRDGDVTRKIPVTPRSSQRNNIVEIWFEVSLAVDCLD